ncbi:MAG: hypothetical protein Q9220_002478 [cf. Caloplaca sp. 1 TL-2023]
MPTTISFLLSLLPLALSSPIVTRQASSYPPTTFGVIAARSASPIHFQPINANGLAFWIGKNTATYCPLTNQTQCPPGTETVFAVGGGGASLDTEVPGGQEVYVAPSGALGYTQAHSGSYPTGSALQTFNATVNTINGNIGQFTFQGLGAAGFLACPATANGTGPYQIFADVASLSDEDVPGGCKDACLGFDALTAEYTEGPAAWQYI